MGHKHIETLSEASAKHADSEGDNGNAMNSFEAGAGWMREQFSLHGTTDCRTCDTGRATLYATHDGKCLGCAHAVHETKDKT